MDLQEYDPRTISSCTITWFEDSDSGRCYFLARFDAGGQCEIPEENAGGGPITAASDSHEIAEAIASELSLEVISVDHDGDILSAVMRQL